MSARVAKAMRRRRLVLVVAAIGCSLLVLLPLIGVLRIDDKVEEGHDYVLLVSSTNDLSRDLIQLTTLELAAYGSAPSPETEAAALAGLADARVQLRDIQGRIGIAERLGIDDRVSAQLALASTYLDGADQYMAEIAAGAAIAESPAAQVVIEAATQILANQEDLAISLPPVNAQLSHERQAAVNDAMTLLVVAAGVAVVTLGTLAFVDGRRVERTLQDEAGKREQAERVAAHRADVVSMASHELRNPLTVLMMTADILYQSAKKHGIEEITTLAGDARVAAVRCNLLVDELLDLGRLDAERLQLRIGVTPLLPAVQSAVQVSIAQHGPREVEVSGEASSEVSADPARLTMILRNLIDNAFKYSPTESTVRIHIVEESGRVRVDVLDQGAGVEAAHQDLIFQRYHRAPATAHVSGIGIGLFLSRELARRMDGELSYVDGRGGGDFRLELPVARAVTS